MKLIDWTELYTGIKYILVSAVLDPSILEIPTNMMMIMSGMAKDEASLMVFA